MKCQSLLSGHLEIAVTALISEKFKCFYNQCRRLSDAAVHDDKQ